MKTIARTIILMATTLISLACLGEIKARLTWTKLRIQTKDPEQKQRAAEHINTLSRANQ